MAKSVVDLVNRALDAIGWTSSIHSLDDRDATAIVAKRHWEPCRDEVLVDVAPSWAEGREELSLVNETATGWEYVYGFPADCLEPRYILPESDRVPMQKAVSSDGSQRVVLTNAEDAELVYTKRVESPLLFSPGYENAVVWRLAADFALALKKDVALYRSILERDYAYAVTRARAQDAGGEHTPDSTYVPASIAARNG